MKRKFTDDENLEQFLRQNADSLRMRPSNKVWKEISKELNKRNRRIGFSLAILLLTISSVSYFLFEQQTNTIHKPVPVRISNGPSASSTDLAKPAPNEKSGQKSTAFLSSGQYDAIGNKYDNAGKQSPSLNKIFQPLPDLTETVQAKTHRTNQPLTVQSFTPVIAAPFVTEANEKETVKDLTSNVSRDIYPQSNTSVVYTHHPNTKKKMDWQLVFAPTISYRKLGENKSYLRAVPQFNAPYNYAALYNINDVVTDKPNMGFELGLMSKYQIFKGIKLLGGLQFNVNRYDIKAFNAYTGIATIALNSGRRVDSVRAFSTYSNQNIGQGSNWLRNIYFQVSMPVGLEFKLQGDDKVQFGVATTIQPTYILGDRAYIISTDYKNYTEVPWLTRHWNVNTSLETFVGYSTGHLKWQVGPQVRYQLLSSFINKYPVKENLFDFGLKVGISLNNH